LFSKVLIANRGEIAVRVLRAAKELGITTVAVYSDPDRESLSVRLADEAVPLGGAKSADSYLNIPKLIRAARETHADAIHPGYGFLSESTAFSEACAEAGVTFIGPTVENLRLSGNKLDAKQTMRAAGIPIIPGSLDGIGSFFEATRVANEIGYPVILKAAAGGGGRGMRICNDRAALEEEFPIARAEASAAFGDGTMYIEKLITNARHVEVQVLGDGRGGAVHLGERNCSVQRRHQKLIEESPSPGLPPYVRDGLCAAAVQGVRHMRYQNAGTMEFLVDPEGHFYFMEINARIQVEHPVTEMVTGVDLVKEQFKIAAGEPTLAENNTSHVGCAIECRINAEDPESSFLPSPGKIESVLLPGGPGVRIDTHIFAGYEVPIYYDTLLAKLIVHGRDREEAMARLLRCLDEFEVAPIQTTIPLHRRILRDPDFRAGRYYTDFLTRYVAEEEEDE